MTCMAKTPNVSPLLVPMPATRSSASWASNGSAASVKKYEKIKKVRENVCRPRTRSLSRISIKLQRTSANAKRAFLFPLFPPHLRSFSSLFPVRFQPNTFSPGPIWPVGLSLYSHIVWVDGASQDTRRISKNAPNGSCFEGLEMFIVASPELFTSSLALGCYISVQFRIIEMCRPRVEYLPSWANYSGR